MGVYVELARRLADQLRLSTHPLAIRLLRNEDEIPDGAERPRRDLGTTLNTCVCFAASRRQGKVVAQLLEDMWCPEPAIGYGMVEAPAYFLGGHNRWPKDVATLEAGQQWASREFPRFDAGSYVGIVSAPLETAPFEPDVIVIYADGARLTHLLLAAAYVDGRDVPNRIGGHAACVYAVVPPLEEGSWWVSAPCMGDRGVAAAGDDEMIFSLPATRAADLLEGLEHLDRHERRLPFDKIRLPEYELAEPYARIAREIGITRADGSQP